MMDQKKYGIALSYIYIVLQSIVSIAFTPFLLRTIGNSEYGLYQTVGSLIGYVSIMETTLCSSVLRYYVLYKSQKNKEKMESTLAISQKIFKLLSIFTAVMFLPIYFIVIKIFENSFSYLEIAETGIILAILFVNIIVSNLNYIYTAAINAHENYIFLKISSIIALVIQPLIVILVIRQYKYAYVIALSQLALNFILSYVRKYYAINKLGIIVAFHGKDKELESGLIRFSAGVLLVTVSDQIFWKTDQIILGAMYGTNIVAIYSIGSQINNMFINIGNAIGNVLLPTSTRKVIQGNLNQISVFFTKVGSIQAFILFLIFSEFILFGKEFIFLWVGSEFDSAFYIAILLMIPYFIDLIQNAGLSILQAYNKYSFRGMTLFGLSILNIISTIFLAKRYGAVGAALSTTLSLTLGSGIIMNWYYHRIGIDIVMFWKKFLSFTPSFAISIFLGYLIKLIEIKGSLLQFIFHASCYLLIYCTLFYVTAIRKNERKQLSEYFLKLRR